MKMYLGDSVYAEYHEGEAIDGILLTTENGDSPSNRIFMEPGVFQNFIEFVNQIRRSNGAEPIVIPRSK